MISKSSFAEWKAHEAYVELDSLIKGNMSLIAAEIVNRTEPANNRDMYLRGFLKGLSAILEWEPDFSYKGDVEGETDA